MRLADKQAIFTEMLTSLLAYARAFDVADGKRYRIRLRDVYRDPRSNYGHMQSTHRVGLAADILVDVQAEDGTWKWVKTNCPMYEAMAKQWAMLGTKYKMPARWGGEFKDYNHFSIEHNGIR